MMNVIDLLTRSGMFVRDLEDWDRKSTTDQTRINLRPFVQEAYQQGITSGAMTSAKGGYTGGGNRFVGLTAKDDVSDDNTVETIVGTINLHMANLSMQTAATIKASKAQMNASLQQMVETQAHLQQQQHQMMQQMAMMLYAPPQAPIQYQPAHFPQQQNTRFVRQVPAGRAAGRGSGSRGGGNRCARGGGRVGMIVPMPIPCLGGNQMIPYIPAGAQQQQVQPPQNPRFSNIVKVFVNQNACFTCGFDVDDWHTSATCPNKKAGRQDGFTCSNYMEYERANHQFCRKGMHKTMYPMWWCGAVNVDVKLEMVNSTISSYPTRINVAASIIKEEDHNITVMASNCSREHCAANSAKFAPEDQHYANMLIEMSHAIADMGATSNFVMEGMPMENIKPTMNPITINLPDGKKVTSTHTCDITILGLPTVLIGHIVPGIKVALFFGIRVLCKAGCTVTFDDEKCVVEYNNKIILRGYKDPSTDLWTLPLTPGKMWTTPGTPAK
jgi:hypothetical protein